MYILHDNRDDDASGNINLIFQIIYLLPQYLSIINYINDHSK